MDNFELPKYTPYLTLMWASYEESFGTVLENFYISFQFTTLRHIIAHSKEDK